MRAHDADLVERHVRRRGEAVPDRQDRLADDRQRALVQQVVRLGDAPASELSIGSTPYVASWLDDRVGDGAEAGERQQRVRREERAAAADVCDARGARVGHVAGSWLLRLRLVDACVIGDRLPRVTRAESRRDMS